MKNVRLRFRGQSGLLVGLGIAAEAGTTLTPLGGNEATVPDLAAFDDEQLAELDRLTRDPLPTDGPTSTAVVERPIGRGPDRNPRSTADVVAVESEAASPGAADDTEDTGSVGDPPPRTGPGASRAAWVGYADRLRAAGADLPVITDDQSRDDIIALVEAHNAR